MAHNSYTVCIHGVHIRQITHAHGITITRMSNNSGCVPSVGGWVEPTLSHVIFQLMIISTVGTKHQCIVIVSQS